jgi:hypothetical protein
MSKRAWNFARTLSWPARAEAAEQIYYEVSGKTDAPLLQISPSEIVAISA